MLGLDDVLWPRWLRQGYKKNLRNSSLYRKRVISVELFLLHPDKLTFLLHIF